MIVAIAIAAGGVEAAAQPPPPGGPATQEAPATSVPSAVLLAPGQIQTVDVTKVTRVAIGDPAIADVTIISPAQILVQAKHTGSTNLILWDAAGQHQTTISVIDPASETIGKEITALVQQLAFPSVEVKLQSGKVFLLGEVASDAELGVLEQMATSFKDVVVNLVKVREPAAPPVGPAPLVKLSVQVLEVNHTATEKLGVNWSSSLSLTDPEVTDRTTTTALTRFGTSLTRSSLAWTINALVQDNKARILSEPTLVTASGKEASSFIGVEVPVIQATSVGTSTQSVNASIEFRQTGVLLKITPTVIETDDGQKITTVLLSEVSDVDKSVGLSVPVGSQTIVVPGFKTRKTSTEVTTVSGETIVIAGLLELEDSHTMSQVPALGSLPVLGRLFRTPEISDTRNELVITVTPELLADQANQADRGLALEQALAVAEVTASVQDPRLRYALQIQDRIAKQLRYPQREKELGLDGTVKLRLHLFRDGTLGRAMVSSSSGIEALDMEALKVAESQAPYPSFPSQLAEQELWLEVPVIFRP